MMAEGSLNEVHVEVSSNWSLPCPLVTRMEQSCLGHHCCPQAPYDHQDNFIDNCMLQQPGRRKRSQDTPPLLSPSRFLALQTCTSPHYHLHAQVS